MTSAKGRLPSGGTFIEYAGSESTIWVGKVLYGYDYSTEKAFSTRKEASAWVLSHFKDD